jgi:hypothetical protein
MRRYLIELIQALIIAAVFASPFVIYFWRM